MENEIFNEYSIADYLKTKEKVEHMLESILVATMKDNNPAMLISLIEDISHSIGMTGLVENVFQARERMYSIISQYGNHSFDTALMILEDMGFRLSLKHYSQ